MGTTVRNTEQEMKVITGAITNKFEPTQDMVDVVASATVSEQDRVVADIADYSKNMKEITGTLEKYISKFKL